MVLLFLANIAVLSTPILSIISNLFILLFTPNACFHVFLFLMLSLIVDLDKSNE